MPSVKVIALAAVFAAGTSGQSAAGDLQAAGDVLQLAIPAAALGITAFKQDGDGAWQLGATYATTLGVTHAAKLGFEHTDWDRRPDGGNSSFPSGHTSSAFAGAAYLHFRYGWEYGLPAVALASLTGYSRVEADKHHVRDVFAGALIGYGSAYLLTDAQNENVTILPFAAVTKPSIGLVAKIRF